MQIFKITVKPQVDRIDQFLAQEVKKLSRSKAKKLINDGYILVNDSQVEASYKLKKGDKIKIEIPSSPEVALRAQKIPLKIIYEDKDLLVIDKPAGLIVHPTLNHLEGTVVNALLNHLASLNDGVSLRPGIVHRLDKNTSGVLVVGKNKETVEELKKEFSTRTVEKTYLVLVQGRVEKERGEITGRIGRHQKFRSKFTISDVGREALTEYKVLERIDNKFTLLAISPKTGRTHQIRVHLQSLGHPIVGDKLYGGKMVYRRQFLHALTLKIIHPRTRKEMVFNAPLPNDLKAFLQKIGSKINLNQV